MRIALRRLLGDLDLGDQRGPGRGPAGELDAGRLADQAASAVGRHQVRRAHRGAVGQVQVDAVGVLGEADNLSPRWIGTPSPPTQSARMRSIWLCNRPSVYGCRVGRSLMSTDAFAKPAGTLLPRSEETVGDASLVEDLDGA